jgi:predicted transcriptional regulator
MGALFPSVRVPEIDATLTKANLKLKGMEVDGLIETQDGDTYRITEKGNALAAQYREKV